MHTQNPFLDEVAKLTPQITNGLVRDLLMTLMFVIAMFGLVDVVQKPKTATA